MSCFVYSFNFLFQSSVHELQNIYRKWKKDYQKTKGKCQKKDAEGHPGLSSLPIGPKPIQQQISTSSTSQSPKESTPVRVTVISPQKQRHKKATKKVPEATTVQPPKSSKQNVEDNSGSNVCEIISTSIQQFLL